MTRQDQSVIISSSGQHKLCFTVRQVTFNFFRECLRRSISQDDPLINWITPAPSTERHARRSWSVGQGRLTFFITGVLSVASESDTAYEKGSGQPPVRENIRYSNCIEAVFYYLFMRETNSSCNVRLIDAVYYFASQGSKMFDCFEF